MTFLTKNKNEEQLMKLTKNQLIHSITNARRETHIMAEKQVEKYNKLVEKYNRLVKQLKK